MTIQSQPIIVGLGEALFDHYGHESSIRNHVTAEINLAHFIRAITTDTRAEAISLIVQLDKYLAEIN